MHIIYLNNLLNCALKIKAITLGGGAKEKKGLLLPFDFLNLFYKL